MYLAIFALYIVCTLPWPFLILISVNFKLISISDVLKVRGARSAALSRIEPKSVMVPDGSLQVYNSDVSSELDIHVLCSSKQN